MGYSGFEEHICVKGHYSAFDGNSLEIPNKCHCGSEFKWIHSVDTTNGYGQSAQWETEGNPISESDRYYDQEAPKKVIGEEDHWHADKYGNRYSTQEKLYEPDSDVWSDYKEYFNQE